LEVCAIGSPAALVENRQGTLRWAGPDEFDQLPLVRSVKSHKGTFGHVLLVAGSLGRAAPLFFGPRRVADWRRSGHDSYARHRVAHIAAGMAEYMSESLESTDEGTIAISNLREIASKKS